jgi:hypothetical protein
MRVLKPVPAVATLSVMLPGGGSPSSSATAEVTWTKESGKVALKVRAVSQRGAAFPRAGALGGVGDGPGPPMPTGVAETGLSQSGDGCLGSFSRNPFRNDRVERLHE